MLPSAVASMGQISLSLSLSLYLYCPPFKPEPNLSVSLWTALFSSTVNIHKNPTLKTNCTPGLIYVQWRSEHWLICSGQNASPKQLSTATTLDFAHHGFMVWFSLPRESRDKRQKSNDPDREREKFLYLDKTWDASSRFQGPLDEFTLFHPKTLCVALWNFESI